MKYGPRSDSPSLAGAQSHDSISSADISPADAPSLHQTSSEYRYMISSISEAKELMLTSAF
jgi:hypothetical protein